MIGRYLELPPKSMLQNWCWPSDLEPVCLAQARVGYPWCGRRGKAWQSFCQRIWQKNLKTLSMNGFLRIFDHAHPFNILRILGFFLANFWSAVVQGNCPPLPSGRTDDLTRWILQMQATCFQPTCDPTEHDPPGNLKVLFPKAIQKA